MGWENRGKRQYYYRKRREGRRVVSQYVGTGELAALAATLDALDRLQREMECEAWRRQRDVEGEIAAEVDRLDDLVRGITYSVLLASGFHTHKGQWRRKRER